VVLDEADKLVSEQNFFNNLKKNVFAKITEAVPQVLAFSATYTAQVTAKFKGLFREFEFVQAIR
jgi:superfamily II DNA/RNA helicase